MSKAFIRNADTIDLAGVTARLSANLGSGELFVRLAKMAYTLLTQRGDYNEKVALLVSKYGEKDEFGNVITDTSDGSYIVPDEYAPLFKELDDAVGPAVEKIPLSLLVGVVSEEDILLISAVVDYGE